ncbi:MAG: NADH-quinone oxidoreductase subunit NuoF [Calditrichaeota bacterium]|jgi:NADH-quinone oxidoreductase subunit F|nr:NADH-quinone oxidoreductase subunit NuoF [Calditrichota bacterium]
MSEGNGNCSLVEVADGLKAKYEQPRAALVPLLFAVQTRDGRVTDEAEQEIADLLQIDTEQVHEAVTFYPLLSEKPLGKILIQVCHNISCSLLGVEPLIDVLENELGIKAGEVTPDGEIGLRRSECLGCCCDAPMMLVGEKFFGNLTEEKVKDVVAKLKAGEEVVNDSPLTPTNEIENPALSGNFKVPNASSIKVAEARGAYQIAKKVLKEMSPEEITNQVKASGLRGQGGAGFPTGLKWSFVPKTDGQKYLTVNCDESEPGTCKDREILRRDPHKLIEGIIIASKAIGVTKSYIYIRREFYEPAQILDRAIQEAYDSGYLGKDILGTGMDLDVYTHPGGGAYICGEETGLIQSLEGRKGWPRIKPPFPAVQGLFWKPTVVNNVETISNVPFIMEKGVEAYRSRGTEKSPGTKLFGVSGHVKRPGVYELPMGVPLRDLIFGYADGIREGHSLKAVIPGGSSVPILKAEEIDVNMDFESTAEAGTMLGSGGAIVMDETVKIPEALEVLSRFYAHESCGQCTPCREGGIWIYKILHRMNSGLGRKGDIELLLDLAANMDGTTICPLAAAAAWPVQSAIKKFPEEFEALLY